MDQSDYPPGVVDKDEEKGEHSNYDGIVVLGFAKQSVDNGAESRND